MHEEDMQLVLNLLWGGEDDSDVPLIERKRNEKEGAMTGRANKGRKVW